MEKRIFKGIYGIVLTPFKENGDVDYDTLAKQVEKTMKSDDLTGLVVCGSTGEFSRLSFEENTYLMKTVKDAMGRKKQFICGTTASDSYTAKRYTKYAEEIGADGILIAPPYYFTLNDEEIFEYYKDVITSTSLPVVGYNIPQCTNPVSVSNFEKLLEFDNFKGFKNSWNDLQQITTEIGLRNEKRPDVAMLTGLDACLYGTLSLGGDGVFSAITYLMPEIIGFIQKNCGTQKGLKCQTDLIKLINVVNKFTFPYGYRVLSDALNMPLGEGREVIPPSVKEKADVAKTELKEIYNKLLNDYIK